jgi:hypothetical protein
VVQAGETPSPDDQATAYTRLNALLGKWRLRRLTDPVHAARDVHDHLHEGHDRQPLHGRDGWGRGDCPPAAAQSARRKVSGHERQSDAGTAAERYTDAAWQAIPQKNLTSTLPTDYYYNPTYASGLGSLYLWMVPTQSNLQGVVYAPAGVRISPAVSDTITRAGRLRHVSSRSAHGGSLAGVPRERPLDPGLVQNARDSMDAIKTANLRMVDLSIDPMFVGGGWYDINSDSY